MNLQTDLKHPDYSIQFLSNKSIVSLQLKENFLCVKCLKKLNPFDPRPFSSFHSNIYLCDILSTAVKIAEWKVHSKVESLSSANIGNLLHSQSTKCYVLLVHVAVKAKGSIWKLQTLKFRSNDERHCINWSKFLNDKIAHVLSQDSIVRPRSLLVFVNPYGGKHKAVEIHKQIVTPIFDKACVKQKVVITEYQNHAKDYLQSADLSEYDGIIAVGGDGMAHEIINGILIQMQERNSITLDRSPSELSEKCPNFLKPGIRIGVIPAGSTNCLSYVTQGYDDPETAALHIVVGDNHPLDLCSIHDRNGTFQRFSFSMTSFGFYGNVLKLSERMRKLGPSRYDFAGIHHFVQQSSYDMEVQYLPSTTKIVTTNTAARCRFPCNTCHQRKKYAIDEKDDECLSEPNLQPLKTSNGSFSNNAIYFNAKSNFTDGPSITFGRKVAPMQNSAESLALSNDSNDIKTWQVARGKFLMINSALMSCACGRCPQGLSPSAHLADGNIDLILVRNCSKVDFLRYMVSHVGSANRFRFPFVEVHRVKAFRCVAATQAVSNTKCELNANEVEVVESHKASGCWNTDGEMVTDPSIFVWVHKGLIKLFTRGIEPNR